MKSNATDLSKQCFQEAVLRVVLAWVGYPQSLAWWSADLTVMSMQAVIVALRLLESDTCMQQQLAHFEMVLQWICKV